MVILILITLTACDGQQKEATADSDGNVIEDLKIQFVPSRELDETVAKTEPLKEILKTMLAKKRIRC